MATGTMSTTANSIFQRFLQSGFVQLSPMQYKGQSGRVLVIGGCEEYTGAPYFAAISAMKSGSDLSHVICSRNASLPIKSYSPELIVHPLLPDFRRNASQDTDHAAYLDSLVSDSIAWAFRMDAIAVGPGLGRDIDVIHVTKSILRAVLRGENPNEPKNNKKSGAITIPIILDADGLWILNQEITMLRDAVCPVYVTPNKVEYDRLVAAIQQLPGDEFQNTASPIDVARCLGPNVIVVRKGLHDEIAARSSSSDSYDALECDEPGSLRRCGGQGDLLTGCLLALTGMQARKLKDQKSTAFSSKDVMAAADWSLPAYVACAMVRRSSRAAFIRKRRGMMASDILEELSDQLESAFPSPCD